MKTIAAAVLLAMSSTAWAQFGQVDPRANVGLKDAYKDYFTIGVALNQRNVSDDAQKALVKQETYNLYDEEVAAFKRNRQFRSGDAYYKVLSNGDVTYLKPASRDIEDVTVPNQVKKGKFFFKVSNNAFRNCKNLKWAVISKNVYVFGQYIFARDEKLTKVKVLGTGFKSGKVSDAFVRAGKNGKLTVKVPGNKVDEYRELFTGEGGLNGKVEAA